MDKDTIIGLLLILVIVVVIGGVAYAAFGMFTTPSSEDAQVVLGGHQITLYNLTSKQIENLEGNNTDSITVYGDDGQHMIAMITAENQSNSMYSECEADGTLDSANVFKSNNITYYTFIDSGTVNTVFRIGDTDYAITVYDAENSTCINDFSIGLQILSGNPNAFVNSEDVTTVSSSGSTGSSSTGSGSSSVSSSGSASSGSSDSGVVVSGPSEDEVNSMSSGSTVHTSSGGSSSGGSSSGGSSSGGSSSGGSSSGGSSG